jgi:hypothetical protein
MKSQLVTTAPVEPGETQNAAPEWGRIRDVERLYGIRRGTTYAMIRQKKIKTCLLRVQGNVSGLRLVNLQSVRDFIAAQLKENEQMEVAE